MLDPRNATVANHRLPASAKPESAGWRLVRRAPQPESPDAPDRAGRSHGMAIAIVAGVAFWGAVAAGVAFVLN